MEEIEHRLVNVGALKLHIAEIGTELSPPDFRGYGLSDSPPQPEKTNFSHLLHDLLAILDALSLSKVFIVGKDFGSSHAYLFSILHPEMVLGVITLGVPYVPPHPALYHKLLPEGFYILRWRSFGEDFNLPDPVVKVPALLIMGGKDYVFKFPGIEDLTKGEKAKEFVPNLEITFIPEGTHFVQEQFPEQVNQLILAFLAKHV
ncbi:hypothetical protein RYX36_034943 [Vicia faba]